MREKLTLEQILTLPPKKRINYLFNEYAVQFADPEDNIKETLTEEEINIITKSIKTKKDQDYNNYLKRLNSVFLYFKEKATAEINKTISFFYKIDIHYNQYKTQVNNAFLLTDLLNAYTDNEQKKQALVKITSRLNNKEFNINEKGVEVKKEFYYSFVKNDIDTALDLLKSSKEYINLFKIVLKTDLPIKVYKVWLKKQEAKLQNVVNSLAYTTTGVLNMPELWNIPKYEDIKAIITDEDLQDFRSSEL